MRILLRRLLGLGAALLILYGVFPSHAFAVSTSASAAILMDVDSGRVLYEHNADQRMRIASTTKILTALVAIEQGNLRDLVTVSQEAAYKIGRAHV